MAKILIADDAEFMRFTLGNILTKAGHQVLVAKNGEEAYLLYRKEEPDVVMMDIVMPVMNGIEAVAHIREYDRMAKVVMCSHIDQQDMIKQALKAGAKDYILKPFVEANVLAAVERMMTI